MFEAGHEKKGGRQKGTPNKTAAEIRSAAQRLGPSAISTLAELMKNSRSDSIRIAAARELLERGYGKPKEYEDPRPVQMIGIGNLPISSEFL